MSIGYGRYGYNYPRFGGIGFGIGIGIGYYRGGGYYRNRGRCDRCGPIYGGCRRGCYW